MKNETIERFKRAKYGMMVHWGLYSMLAGEYKGRMSGNYAEWVQHKLQIPVGEMQKLAAAFNPVYFDADEWAALAKSAGMAYMVVTAKHHEGFSLFDSKADGFNIAAATPFKRDVIAELAAACKKHGLLFGVYYSQDLDWHEKDGGGYTMQGETADNFWDFPNQDNKDYERCFRKKILPQVAELVTNYGDLFLIWFDVPRTMNLRQSTELFELVKKHQPECLVNSRLGNNVFDYTSLDDNEIPDSLPAEGGFSTHYNETWGIKYSKFGLYESACTLNDSWGFCARDQNWKSAEQILQNKRKLNRLNVNYLINVGPDALGRIPARAAEILARVRKKEEEKQ